MSERKASEHLRKTASAIVTVTAIVHAVLFLKLLTMVDFAEPLHVMLLLSTALVFGTIGFGLIALGTYCRAWILQAARPSEGRG